MNPTALHSNLHLQPGAAARPAAAREVLTFLVGADEFAVDIGSVCEVRAFEAPTPAAGQPRAVLGTIDLRGRPMPVMDLRLRFGAGDGRCNAFTVTVILQSPCGTCAGVVVDAVSDVLALRAGQVRPAHPGEVDADMPVCGVAVVGQGPVERSMRLLDVESLLSPLAGLPAAAAATLAH